MLNYLSAFEPMFTTILPLCRSSKKVFLLVVRVMCKLGKESVKKPQQKAESEQNNQMEKMTEKSVLSGPVLVFFGTGPGPVLFFQNGLFLVLGGTQKVLFWYFLFFFGTFLLNSRPQGPVRIGEDRTGPDRKKSLTPGPDRTKPNSKMAWSWSNL